MPSDFGDPVAQNVNVNPSGGLKTISDLMSLQQQQQQIQQGGLTIQQQQQNLQKGAASTQMEQQSAAQRQNLANFDWQSIADKEGLPSVDTAMSNPALKTAAGDQFLQVLTHIGTARQQALQNRQSLFDLNDSVRTKLQSTIGGLRTDPDVQADNQAGKQKVQDALNAFSQNGGPQAEKVAQIYGPGLKNVQQGGLARALANFQQQAMSAPAQATGQTPSYVSTGGAAVQTNPLAAGGNIGDMGNLRMTPAPQMGINPATGQPYTLYGPNATPAPQTNGAPPSFALKLPNGEVFKGSGQEAQTKMQQLAQQGDYTSAQELKNNLAAAGITQSSTKAQGGKEWPSLGQFPTPQQVDSAKGATAETDAVRAVDSNPVTGYQSAKQAYTNLLNLVAKNPAIGPTSKSWNQLTGILTPFGASPNSSMQEVDSYLDRLALQNAGSAGLTTDQARHMSAVAAGTTEMNPTALKEKLRFGSALLEASHVYREGLDKVVGTTNQNPIAKRSFDSLWTQNADIDAFRLLAAKNNDDKEGFNQQQAKMKAMPADKKALIQKHMNNLNLLSQGQMPQ